MDFQIKWVSSLEKIFSDEDRSFFEQKKGSALLGEKYHMQIAFKSETLFHEDIRFEIKSEITDKITAYSVKSVPVMQADTPYADDNFLRKTAGLYPDLLVGCDGVLTTLPKQWRSIFFEIEISEDVKPGNYPIEIFFYKVSGNELLASSIFELEVIGAALPEQSLIYTSWVHYDSLSHYYNTPVFSEKHWEIMDNYINSAAKYGINMILTPIFTPPIDTPVGEERLTVQLVNISLDNGEWNFDFSNLLRFIKMAKQSGMKYFEFPHFFTQWGAAAAPKIMVAENGELKRKFGWETSSTSKEYVGFLNEFIPSLKNVMKEQNLLENSYFHISDEPSLENIESYELAYGVVKELLSDCNVIDALSNYEFYKKGLVKKPIPNNAIVETFIENGVDSKWTYYCCCQLARNVSNRLIAMPSYRTRIFGMQLFKYKIEGFLHWGYNFWLNRLSRKPINPYFCTDGEDYYPAGDAFVVYPADDGTPLHSIRELVFYDGLQDMRALELLASLSSFEEAVELLDSSLNTNLTFKNYPNNISGITNARNAINEKIKQLI